MSSIVRLVFLNVEAPAKNKICSIVSRAVQSFEVKALPNTKERMQDFFSVFTIYGIHNVSF